MLAMAVLEETSVAKVAIRQMMVTTNHGGSTASPTSCEPSQVERPLCFTPSAIAKPPPVGTKKFKIQYQMGSRLLKKISQYLKIICSGKTKIKNVLISEFCSFYQNFKEISGKLAMSNHGNVHFELQKQHKILSNVDLKLSSKKHF
jgi:hypothetical protein